MEPRASFGSFTIRGRRANEPAKHYRTRLMADGKFVAGWLAVKVSEVDHRALAKSLCSEGLCGGWLAKGSGKLASVDDRNKTAPRAGSASCARSIIGVIDSVRASAGGFLVYLIPTVGPAYPLPRWRRNAARRVSEVAISLRVVFAGLSVDICGLDRGPQPIVLETKASVKFWVLRHLVHERPRAVGGPFQWSEIPKVRTKPRKNRFF